MNLTLRILPVLLGGLVIAGLSGCAAPQTERILSSAIARPASAEIANVPFFPQEQFYCGPASLAMVLSWSGSPITPGDVTGEVYTPGREGTFAPDIVAAARRHGRLAVDVRDLATLLAALERPCLGDRHRVGLHLWRRGAYHGRMKEMIGRP